MKDAADLLRRMLKRLFGGGPWRGRNPYAGSPVRNKRGPKDRGAAVALAEPEDK